MKKTLCLVMIVKNEEKQLARCFSSVKDHIDTYCIIDTGSTDNTIEVIQKELSGIPGKVIERPWVNFGHNRTESLKLAKGMADYLLLSDADEQIIFSDEFDSTKLGHDQYLIRYQGNLDYSVPYLIKGDIDWFFVGVTHEYLSSDQYVTRGSIETISILDHGDGGSKSDKFSRDIRLLEQGMIDEPNNARYMFYLANSYRDVGNNSKAIEWYQKRIKAGGWAEEVTMSYESMGKCYSRLSQNAMAIDTWLKGYDYNTNRAECLYYAVNKLREDGRYKLAYNLAKIAKKIPYPKNDILFIDRSVYEWKIDYEISICAYYADPTKDMRETFSNLLAKPNRFNQNVLSNYRFYCKSIKEAEIQNIDLEYFVDKSKGYNNSSPAITVTPEGNYLVNVRKVSYKLLSNGGYTNFDGSNEIDKFNTINTELLMDKDFNLLNRKDFVESKINQLPVNGLEDIRLLQTPEGVHFNANIWTDDGKIRIAEGKYENDELDYRIIESPNDRQYEKNWSAFQHKDQLLYVYEWDPITIGFTKDNQFVLTEIKEANLHQVRGNSPGFLYQNEYWFLVHIVYHNEPRNYYHAIVRLDAETLEFKSLSKWFTFESKEIEFGLGLIVEDERIIITYSTWDKTSRIGVYNKEKLSKNIFNQ